MSNLHRESTNSDKAQECYQHILCISLCMEIHINVNGLTAKEAASTMSAGCGLAEVKTACLAVYAEKTSVLRSPCTSSAAILLNSSCS